MKRALLLSFHYLLISMFFSLWPALLVGLLVYSVAPEWELEAFIAVFSYVLTGFIFKRKANWLG